MDLIAKRNFRQVIVGNFILSYNPGFSFGGGIVFEPSVRISNRGAKIIIGLSNFFSYRVINFFLHRFVVFAARYHHNSSNWAQYYRCFHSMNLKGKSRKKCYNRKSQILFIQENKRGILIRTSLSDINDRLTFLYYKGLNRNNYLIYLQKAQLQPIKI